MKNLKKQEEFSKILDLGKEDVANLTEKEMNKIQGGDVWPSCDCNSGACSMPVVCFPQAS